MPKQASKLQRRIASLPHSRELKCPGSEQEDAIDEEEFDSLMQFRPFGTADAMRSDERLRRAASLGVELWGRRTDDLQRQLLRARPQIPTGCELADFRELLRSADIVSACLVTAAARDPRFRWLPPQHLAAAPTISVGAERFTPWEARCEIVRRAIEYLEGL